MAEQLRVMISSTAADLPEHRKQVVEACLRQGMFPLRMEDLPATSDDAAAASVKLVDDADVFIGVIAHLYGYVPKANNPDQISVTEMEYNRAVERKIPCLVFLMHEDHPVRQGDVETGLGAEKLKAFKERIMRSRITGLFKSPEDLRAEVITSLSRLRQIESKTFHYGEDDASSEPFQPSDEASSTVANEPSSDSQETAEVTTVPGIETRVRGVILAESAVTSSAASDQPVLDTARDTLGFAVYAKALRDFIASKDTATPLTISIEAAWGQGKSSLMRMIQHELNPRRSWHLRFWLLLKLQGWRLRWLVSSPLWYLGTLGSWTVRRFDLSSKFPGLIEEGMLRPAHEDQKVNIAAKNLPLRREPALSRLGRWSAEARFPVEAYHPTIWFNAWKYDQEEAIWSALASAILEQIKSSRSWLGRLSLWLRLLLKRTNRLRVIKDILRKLFWPMLLAGLVGVWHYQHEYFLSLIGRSLTAGQVSAIKWLLQTALILTSGMKLASIIEDPFSLPFDKYVNAPDYRKKIGFIGEFEQDFKRIVQLVTSPVWGWKPRKLVIFIDDLDRCEPPKSADVIEAINVFLDSPGCVFVIGMDSRAVVASIEVKYEKMFEKLQQENPDHPALGRSFLEKIIQVPFAIPPMSDRFMEPYVLDLIGPKPIPRQEKNGDQSESEVLPHPESPSEITRVPTESPAGEQRKEDVGSYSNVEVWQAISNSVTYLETNPRQLKRFINLFRVQVYISSVRKLFYESAGEGTSHTGYTLDSLGAWTAFSMRWPLIVASLAQEYQQAELRRWLLIIAGLLDERGIWIVRSDEELVNIKEPLRRFLSNALAKVPKKTDATPASSPSESPVAGGGAETAIRLTPYWLQLPWELYLDNKDFLQVVKALEAWWSPSTDEETTKVQRDWLSMAMMFQQ